jgi:DNA-3-methyladenine glycosylase
MASSSVSSSKNGWDKAKLLPVSFYRRGTLDVARDLLGKILVVQKAGEGLTAARIVETEAYQGDDPASHSARGETPRSSVMFGEPGVAYVYFIYGMYEMLNFVTLPVGMPGAVLIRAAEPLAGEELMVRRRSKGKKQGISRLELTRGPGKLCQALGIELTHNRQSLQGPVLRVLDDGFVPQEIFVSPRVGIRVGIERYWRFYIPKNPFVSRAPQNAEGISLEESEVRSGQRPGNGFGVGV